MIECVPNFSEGRDRTVLEAIRAAAASTGARVVGLSADPEHNRAVLTLVGEAETVLEAAWAAACEAVARIDLRRHRGVHPRMGAVDVIPFVPLAGDSMARCVDLARRLGRRLGEELGLPVFLYEQAATRPERVNLAEIRRGQFEGLAAKLADPAWQPDFGPAAPHPTAGAVAVGARPPLIAFNVYLNTADVTVARRVARAVRGRDGGLAGVKALGLLLPETGLTQVSMNIVDVARTPLPAVLELVRREAARWGAAVLHTEVVGFLPRAAAYRAAEWALQLPGDLGAQVLEDAAGLPS